MEATSKTFLFDLLATPSPTGFEAEGQKKWTAYVRSFADDVATDAYGSAWATRTGAAGDRSTPRVMIEAHADEIGFMVRYVDEHGFLYINRVGGSDVAIARGKRVTILGDAGPVTGVFGNTAIHIRDRKDEKAPEEHELFVDIGASNRDEVAERGVRVGHPMVYADPVEELAPGRLVGRALDNRIGGFIIAEVMRALAAQPERQAATVQAVNAVQEEIGGHGATMTAFRLRPDVALVVDVCHATDSPGISRPKHGDLKLGGGPVLTHGSANHPAVVKRLMALAERHGIEVQHESTSRFTGTDTDSIFRSRSGVPSGLVSVPMRYMHSTVEMVAVEDVERVVALMTAFVRSLEPDETFSAW